MKRIGLVFAGIVALSGCRHLEPEVRAGPPLHIGFGAPSGMAQLEIAKQERESRIDYEGRDPVDVHEVIRTSQRETWDLLRDGSWRITDMMLDEDAKRDGVPVASAVPLKGVPFVQIVSKDGKFLRLDDVAGTVEDIKSRAPTKELREMLEPLLTPQLLEERMKLAWQRRTEGLCNTDFVPGQVFYGLDRQDLPAGGPALSIVRAKVIGRADEAEPAVELALTFGGGSSDLVKESGAREVAVSLPKDEVLVEELEGHGRRIVSLQTCQVIAEDATLEGSWKLNKAAIGGADPKAFPQKIGFKVRRAARRTAGLAAKAAEPMP